MEALVESMGYVAHVALWEALQGDLRLRLGAELFERWISSLKVLSESGPALKLGAHNLFVQDWIRKRYLPEMEHALRERLAQDRAGVPASGEAPGEESRSSMRIELSIDPDLFRERRKETEEILPKSPRDALSSSPPVAAPGPASLPEPLAKAPHGEQTLESFVVGETSRHVYNAAIEVLQRPGTLYNPLFIHGPSGSGKSHLLKGLARAFRSRRGGNIPLKVSCLTGEQFFQHYVASIQERTLRQFQERYRALDVLLLDDVHLLVSKKKTQVELLHTFCALLDTGRQVVVTSDTPPKGLRDLDAGLVARFSGGLTVGMKKPDFAARLGIARAQARNLAVRFDEEVLRHIAEVVRTGARELLGAVNLLHHHSQLLGGPVGLSSAEQILAELCRDHTRRIDLEKIQAVVATHYGVAPEALVSGGRERHTAFARQVAMYLARHYTPKSLAEVGKYFGNRNHTTVKSAERKITGLLKVEGGVMASELGALMETLEE